jgi:hypothetical protein
MDINGRWVIVTNMLDILNNKKLKLYLPLLLLTISTFAVFWSALGHDFLINWDDRQYILENPAIRGLTFDHLKSVFTTFYIGNYAPLHLISYMLDYEIWGLRASGFIFTNILIHTFNGLLFFLLLKRLAGKKIWILPAALIFLLHPVQVESVVWASQRKTLLAMLFFLLGLYLYTQYKEKDHKYGIWFYLLSNAAFFLALLAKSVVVIFPLVLILFDLCYLEKRDLKALLVDKIPFIIVAAVFSFVAVKSQTSQFHGGETSYHGGSPYTTLLTMLPVLVDYLRMVIWPARLSAYYDVPVKSAIDLEVLSALFLCVILFIAGIILYRRRRDVFFWFALFFVALIPVSQIVPIVTLMNDRYLYFPMLGAAALLGVVFFGDVKGSGGLKSPKRIILSTLFLIMIVSFTSVTLQRIGVWRNSATLWGDAVQKAPKLALTHDCFGEGLMQQGRIDEALSQFRIALSLEPDRAAPHLKSEERLSIANTHNNLGTAYGIKGMTDAAIEQFTIAIQLNPDFANAYFNLGNGLMHKGLVAQALSSFEAAVRLEPDNPAFVANLRQTRGIFDSESGRIPPGR